MGAAIDEAYRGKLAVTVIAAANIHPRRAIPQPVAAKPMTFPRPGDATLSRTARLLPNPTTAMASTPVAHQPVEEIPKPELVVAQKMPAKPKQETLPLEGVSRGRFDKSEPTLYNGEDLDVPTFLRQGVSIKR
jgi:cell division protein FtsZ